MYYLYTDGSCKGNGKEISTGAYGFVVVNENNELLYSEAAGPIKNTTNNKMELQAMIAGLKYMNEHYENFFCKVFTDSAYIFNCFSQKWYISWEKNNWKNSKKEAVKNKELWEELIPFFSDKRFSFNKVKGHSGDLWNEKVDDLVQQAAEK